MKKIVIPVGAGINALFNSAADLFGLTDVEQSALSAVAEGSILRLDAVQGKNLLNYMNTELMTAVDAEQMAAVMETDPEGWYGTLAVLGLVVGPFDRKSQAMNAAVLSLMGLNLSTQRKPQQRVPTMESIFNEIVAQMARTETATDPLLQKLLDGGVPDYYAKKVADDLRAKFGDDVELTKVGQIGEVDTSKLN